MPSRSAGFVLDPSAAISNVTGPRSAAISARSFATPKLIVVVDTEEEFDWDRPFSRSAICVDHIEHQDRAQRVLERYRIKPTYVVDYPVASQERAFRPLREWFDDGRCDIGAHLHPWVNPPYEEEISRRNSYPGNLTEALEREKLARLTDAIGTNFRHVPTIYRAGRYGIGKATGAILEQLGYRIDTSVVPLTDFSREEGPDFSAARTDPFWFGPSNRILEVPLTVGWCGQLRRRGAEFQPFLMSRRGLRLHLPGVFARLALLERIRLTPEGTSFLELKRLTDTMLADGQRIFVFSYHSPSVVPGNTPYVRTDTELKHFLGLIDRYCDYFMGECGGSGGTLDEVHALLAAIARDHVATPIEPATASAPSSAR